MGLCLRLSFIGLVLSATGANRLQGDQPSLQQADVCELLRDPHEHLLNEYPNEYYDCHAHSRFLKLGDLTQPSTKKPS